MRLFVIVIICLTAAQPAWAGDDPAASFLTKLFISVCIPNMGRPAEVRKWAEDKHLGKIENPVALAVFVGSGDNGSAWALPSSVGSFALSIRGKTEGCVVWAKNADPATVEKYFRQIVEGGKRPGVNVRTDQDVASPSPNWGQARSLAYYVSGEDGKSGFEFILLTTEKSGGPFQASLEVARAVEQK